MRRLHVVAALIAFAVGVTGCDGVPAPQNYATVFGRVYDAATNAGIPGVYVSVDTALVAVTAADGSYSVSPVPSGQTDVLVTPPEGYSLSAQPAAFSIIDGDHVRIDITLARG
jgi:hypothetical protein